jgi:hypothetical protein
LFFSVQGVLKVEKLPVHLFIYVQDVAKLCVLVFVSVQGVLKVEKMCVHVFIFLQSVLKCSIPRLCILRKQIFIQYFTTNHPHSSDTEAGKEPSVTAVLSAVAHTMPERQ